MKTQSELSPLIDDVARVLLDELQKDARISWAELARRAGLSPSATAERVRRLEDAGVIRGYHADIDPSSLGLGMTAIIRMSCDGSQYAQLMAFLKSCAQIRECYHVTGGDALMMKVLVSTVEELEGLVMKLLRYGVPTTSLVLSAPLVRTGYDLRPAAGRRADRGAVS